MSSGVSIIFIFLVGIAVCHAQGSDFNRDCIKRLTRFCRCDPITLKFQTADGTCNNLIRRTWGARNTTLRRLVRNAYDNRCDSPRKRSIYRSDLPAPNRVSEQLFKVERKSSGNTDGLSTLFMTFGQFLDHDLTEVPLPNPRCTSKDCRNNNYPCFPILFNEKSFTKCTPFTRSRAQCRRRGQVREQVNILTAWADASQIYSPDPKHFKDLRAFDGNGRLKVDSEGLMPVEHKQGEGRCMTLGGCSLVGDERGDENPPLNSMHTLWVREHNRIAEGLKKVNPHWKEEQLFNMARRIVIAIWQKIVYEEYLPRLIRNKKYHGYRPSVNPSITQAFATSAFRYGHSLIPNTFSRLNNNFDTQLRPLTLQESFFNRLPIKDHGIESIMFGLVANESSVVDNKFAFAIARRLFVRPGGSDHMDLLAINMQRARDHGVASYGRYRRLCGLRTVKTWDQLKKYMLPGAVDAFKKLYRSPYDIDLFAAGIAEKHMMVWRNGKRVELELGPTFECIISRQFHAIRDGDRFFYKRKIGGKFSHSQQRAISKVTMARVMCNNLKGIVSLQREAFNVGSKTNPRVSCDRIPKLDLDFWKDPQNDAQDEDEENIVDDKIIDDLDDDDNDESEAVDDENEVDDYDEEFNNRRDFPLDDENVGRKNSVDGWSVYGDERRRNKNEHGWDRSYKYGDEAMRRNGNEAGGYGYGGYGDEKRRESGYGGYGGYGDEERRKHERRGYNTYGDEKMRDNWDKHRFGDEKRYRYQREFNDMIEQKERELDELDRNREQYRHGRHF